MSLPGVAQDTTVSFVGATVHQSAASTVLSLTAPVAGTQSVLVSLPSGAVLSTHAVTVEPSGAHARSTGVPDRPVPSVLPAGGTVSFRFSAKDARSNAIRSGGARFAAAVHGQSVGTNSSSTISSSGISSISVSTSTSTSPSTSTSTSGNSGRSAGISSASVRDFGDGTYEVAATFHGSGLQYLSVYIAGADAETASIPGSPYQVM